MNHYSGGKSTVLRLLLADRRLSPNTRFADGFAFESEKDQRPMEIVRNATPLMIAAAWADVNTVKVLLSSPQVIDGLELEASDGHTALELAKKGLRKISRRTNSSELLKSRYNECIRLLKAARPSQP